MKTRTPCLLPAAIVLFAFISTVFAQGGKILTLAAPPAKIAVDGDIREWGDSLRYYNAEKKTNGRLISG